jgi:hypothetical protein
LAVALAGRHNLARAKQRIFDMQIRDIRPQRCVALAERAHAALHEVGRVPGGAQDRRVDRLQNVEAAHGCVAVDRFLVFVQERDAGPFGGADKLLHPRKHLAAIARRVVACRDEE